MEMGYMVISLYDLISGRLGNDGYRAITPNESYEATIAFREYLIGRCKKGSKRATQFQHMTFTSKKELEIYQRMMYNNVTKKTNYIAGQDRTAEIEFIKTKLLNDK